MREAPASPWRAERARRPRRRAALALLLSTVMPLAAPLGGCSRPSAPPLEGAVVVLLDTLRADRLGSYGNPRPTSPVLDRLAGRGVLFEQAVTPCSWTLPAVSALLAGRELTARVFDGGLRLSLVETLRDAGVHTAAFTEGGFVSAYFGLDRGFETWEELESAVHLQAPGVRTSADSGGGIERTFARAEDWLRHRPPGRFFLLVHTYEVHAPYRRTRFAAGTPRGRLGETFELADVERVRQGQLELGPTELAYLERLYDGGVRAADAEVGKLLGTLEELGLAERTLVVVTADHGEDLGGRDPRYAGDHGHALYDEQVRIPLIVADPALAPGVGGSGPRRVAEPVRLLDVLPTVLDRLDVAVPGGGEGVSLGPWLRGGEASGRPALLRLFPRAGGQRGPVRTGFRDGQHKVIVSVPFFDPPAPAVELYDLVADPGERDNIAEREPALRDALLARMRVASDAFAAAGLPDLSGRGEVPEPLRRRLEALGYAR